MVHEYCEDETFIATCGDHQVVVMESARCVVLRSYTASFHCNTMLKSIISDAGYTAVSCFCAVAALNYTEVRTATKDAVSQ